MLLVPYSEENISSLGAAVQHNFRRTPLLPPREEKISSLDAAVQHNFRRTQLLPPREENISSLGTVVQHSFRRTQLLPSREENISSLGSSDENISSLGAAVQHNLAPRYLGCQARRQRVQWDPQRKQLHPLHPPGYGPAVRCVIHPRADTVDFILCLDSKISKF